MACRACRKEPESLGHVLSMCPTMAWTLYKERHDRMLHVLVREVGLALGVNLPGRRRAPGGIVETGVVRGKDVTMQVDAGHPTDRQLEARRPDLVVTCERSRRIAIMEVACAWEPGVAERERQKSSKYQELAADLHQQKKGNEQRKYRVKVTPVVVGTMGLVCGLHEHLMGSGLLQRGQADKIVEELQREALCGLVRIIKRHMTL